MNTHRTHCRAISKTPAVAVSGSNFQAILQFVEELLVNLSSFLRSMSWGVSFKGTTSN